MAHDMNDTPEFLNVSARDQYQNVTSYPLVMTNIAIENGHRNSQFSHQQVVIFDIVISNYQRVFSFVARQITVSLLLKPGSCPEMESNYAVTSPIFWA